MQTELQPIEASASPEVPANENAVTLSWAGVYGERQPAHDGLTWGYYGGRWGGFSVADGTLVLADNAVNRVVVNRLTGAITVSTTITNWNDIGGYVRCYILSALGGIVVDTDDHRAGPNGLHGGVTTRGRHEIPVMAAAIRPSTTDGCDPLSVVEISAGQPDVASLDFDPNTQQYAQFCVPMPKSWNKSAITFKFIWSHAAAATFGVVFSLQGLALVDGDAIGQSFGTAVNVTDTGGTTDDVYVSPESAGVVVTVGSPVLVDLVYFRVSRVAANGSDTLNVDARLHAVILIIETDQENDE